MDNAAIQALVKENPRARCLWCANFDHLEKKCKVGLQVPCGRAFNPKGGGDSVPV